MPPREDLEHDLGPGYNRICVSTAGRDFNIELRDIQRILNLNSEIQRLQRVLADRQPPAALNSEEHFDDAVPSDQEDLGEEHLDIPVPNPGLPNEVPEEEPPHAQDREQLVPGNPQLPFLVGGKFPSPPVHKQVQFDHRDEPEVETLEIVSDEGNNKRDKIEEQGFVTRTVLDVTNPNFDADQFAYLFDLSHRHVWRNYHFLRRGRHYPSSRITALISEDVFRTLEYAYVDLPIGSTVGQRVTLEWTRDLFHAIMFIHSEKVVHGRIAPWRVFLDMGDVLKLHLVPHQLIGLDRNPIYTADEVREGQPPSMESDVSSVVSVAYYILQGREPTLDKRGLSFDRVSAATNGDLVRAWGPPVNRPSTNDLYEAVLREL